MLLFYHAIAYTIVVLVVWLLGAPDAIVALAICILIGVLVGQVAKRWGI